MRARRFRQTSRSLLFATLLFVISAGRPGGQTPSQSPPATQATSAISGVVVDANTGRPLAGAVVSLIQRTGAPLASTRRQLTDSHGRFLFSELPAGEGYGLNASRYGYLPADYGRPEFGGLAARFRLGEDEWISTVRITMQRPGAVSGTVIDEHGEPVVGVFVRALTVLLAAGEQHLAAATTTTTDDRGMYRLTGLREGKYLVAVPVTLSAMMVSGGPAVILAAAAM